MKNSIKYLSLFLLAFFVAANVSAKDFVLVIDAGHGGSDPGAPGKKINEKDINLAVANLFGEKVSKNCKGVKVVYTRPNDRFVDLDVRAQIANNVKADLFVSIHVNSAKNGSTAVGSEVFTLGLHRSDDNLEVAQRENSVIELENDWGLKYNDFDPMSPESYIIFELGQSTYMDKSIEFAEYARKELTTTGQRKDRGVKQAGFLVLVRTAMPSVLVELDFISNPTSENFLASATGQEKLATALYNAFCQYLEAQRPNEQKDISQNETEKQSASASSISTTPSTSTASTAPSTEYRVQILASAKQLSLGSPELKGEKDYDFYYDKGLYKYTIGHCSTQREANALMRKLRQKFPQAFVVKFIDGKRH